MKRFFLNISLLAALAFPCAMPLYAHNPAKYAQTSKLSSGNWAKIQVTSSGMQFISNSVISSLGLNPGSVNVYGYGGQQRPDRLKVSEPDDLPLIPSVKVDGGIIFFGTDYITWEAITGQNKDMMTYSHLMHPYSSTGYYFLSDRPLSGQDKTEPEKVSRPVTAGAPETRTFRARLLHEEELFSPGNNGRILLGEDFRTTPSINFRFSLPGNQGNTRFCARMGAGVSNGQASFLFNANGVQLPAASTDVIPALTEKKFVNMMSTAKYVNGNPSELNLGITCSLSGMTYSAALDYIEVEYDRLLSAADGNLYFYDVVSSPVTFCIEGCDANTRIWDVTDPSSPIEITGERNGSVIKFTETAKGLREYVAFRPNSQNCIAVNANGATTVSNQDLHALPNPDMLIISPLRYMSQANELADMHRQQDGMTVHVLSPEVIYNEFSSGTPDVGAFRKLLKMWGDRADADPSLAFPAYCLIMGKATFDNKHATQAVKKLGYPTVPIWQSSGGYSGTTGFCTDDYIGMTHDSDNAFDIGSQKIRTAVGRLPVKSEAEASQMVEKIKEYVLKPNYGAWRNNVMLIADDKDTGAHLGQTETAWKGMIANGNGDSFVYEKLYLDAYPSVSTATGESFPAAKERMMQKWNDGVAFIHYIGHANPRSWTHEQLLTWTDITSFSNQNLPFLYAATCEYAYHDDVTPSGAEEMLLNPDGGIIGTICPARTVFITMNGTLTGLTAPLIFSRKSNGEAMRTGDVMIGGKNNYSGSDTNKLRFSLLGDPAMKIPSPEYRVVLETIDNTNVTNLDAPDYPVVAARSRVLFKGYVEDPEGNFMPDYNGNLEATLYDAERSVITFGHGGDKEGKVDTYLDRKTRLFHGVTRIENGRWEMEILMPTEIENNWSPAKFHMYAYSDTGLEANGASNNLYVYGIDEEAPEDTDGPGIEFFTLNNENFREGDLTHSSPLVLAQVTDPSGINISEAGIGHKMLLILDGKTEYTDVATYFTPDPNRLGTGSIAYPLNNLSPGEHELQLVVWDNANNSSTKSLPFRVGLNQEVESLELLTDCNPAHEKVTFTLLTDRVRNQMRSTIEVFTLNGTKVWSSLKNSTSRKDGTVRETWYLQDSMGNRVPRGIYLCRATVECEEGIQTSKTIKLAVAAQ